MSQRPRKFSGRIAFLAVLVLAMAGALLGHEYVAKQGLGSTPGIAYDAIDSSACIDCHTNESVISLSTVGQGPAAENTGG